MLLKVYSVYDVAAATFLPPFYVRTEAEAIRSVVQAAADKRPGNMLAEYPQQFVLMEIARFDDHTGNFDMYSAHNSLGPVSGLLEALNTRHTKQILES